MKELSIRSTVAFGGPVLLVFAYALLHPQGYSFLAAGPLCGFVGAFAFGRRWGLAVVLAGCFALIAFMFALQDARSALFSDVVWTGFVTGFMFWVAAGSGMLTLPQELRFNGAAAFAIPGAIAGMVFQLLYGPLHYMFDLGSVSWWNERPWEQFAMWLIAGAGGGWLLGRNWRQHVTMDDTEKFSETNRWAIVSIASALIGAVVGIAFFVRSSLPLGLFNSLSPASAAADWLWGWGAFAAGLASIGIFKPQRRLWSAAGLALAMILVFVSYRAEANPWKTQFNSKYAEKLLRDDPKSGDSVYTANLILAQAALDKNDVAAAKQYLLASVAITGARRIEQNGLDMSVARSLFEKGEKDAVVEYAHRGRDLWPPGVQALTRLENAIKAGRRPNFNMRGPGGTLPQQADR